MAFNPISSTAWKAVSGTPMVRDFCLPRVRDFLSVKEPGLVLSAKNSEHKLDSDQ